jgi:ribonuclease VapC
VIFIDAAAIVAILLDEAEGPRLAAILDADPSRPLMTSVIAVWETTAALYRKKNMRMDEAEARVAEFLAAVEIEVVEVGATDLPLALIAFDRYGRHRHPDPAGRNKALNLADCFHYACAKSRRASVLTTDAGFELTDLDQAR